MLIARIWAGKFIRHLVHTDPDGDRNFYRNPGADMMLREITGEIVEYGKSI